MDKHSFTSSFLLLFAGLFLTLPVRAAPPTPPAAVVVSVSSAKLRSGPGSNYPSVGFAQLGDALAVYSQMQDGAWLLVSTDPQVWIAARQVEQAPALPVVVPATAAPTSPPSSGASSPGGPSPGRAVEEPGFPSPGRAVEEPGFPSGRDAGWTEFVEMFREILDSLREADLSRLHSLALASPVALFAIDLLVWGCSLLVPLLTFRWRWFFGAIVYHLFLGPLGTIISIYIAWMILTGSETIERSSPRDLLDHIAGSDVVQGFLILLFIVLTAFTILGGVLFFIALWIAFQILRLLLPGTPASRAWVTTTAPSGYHASSTSSSSTGDSSSADDGYGSGSSYESGTIDTYDDDDDDRDDGDDQEKGSLWDGWLVKW